MLFNKAKRLCYLGNFPHQNMILFITYLIGEKGDKLR